jgi:hypothetical protein
MYVMHINSYTDVHMHIDKAYVNSTRMHMCSKLI